MAGRREYTDRAILRNILTVFVKLRKVRSTTAVRPWVSIKTDLSWVSWDKYKVKEGFLDIETHEVFLDKIAHTREEELGLSEKKFEVKIREKTIYAIFGLFFILTAVLFGKTFYLQVVHGKALHNIAENNKGKISLIRPERGIMYDRNFKKLVVNSPAYDLICEKKNFINETPPEQLQIIAEVLGKDIFELQHKIALARDSSVVVAENLSHEHLLVLETKMSELPDCKIETNTVRNYVMGPVFSHVLGYNGRISENELGNVTNYSPNDYIGKAGLENFYETELRGTPGKTEIVKNAKGVKQGDNILSLPKEGYNLVLNIDALLQERLHNSLRERLKNIGAKRGAAVAMDPRSGAVLALVSYPSYDGNVFSGGISSADFNAITQDPSQPFFNRAISAHYPTGSIIKPLEASAALQEKLISPNKEINDPGYILVRNQYDPSITYRFGGVAPHGLVDMRKAIAVSSNIYFYTVGGGYGDQRGLGPTRIKQYLSLFGWSEKTGIDLPGEFSGFIPDPAWKQKTKRTAWFDGDTYNLSIGQSDLQTTPLQVASAYSVIANGGTLYQPQVVNRVVEGSGSSAITVKQITPKVIRSDFINPEYLKIVREGMRDGVSKPYGLSVILNDLPVKIAAKTGTAQISVEGRYNLWSSVFAPYENPEIVLVVTAEEVNALGAVTLPVSHDVLQYYFSTK